MTIERDVEMIVTPLLERELTASPTSQDLDRWRLQNHVTAAPSTVLGALLSTFDGLSAEHRGVRATIRWFGSTIYAGEKGLCVLMELSTAEARAAVLALERGYERLFGLPVSPDAAARIEELLRQTIEQSSIDGSLPETHFFGAVSEFLQDLPGRLVAEAPAQSLGSFVIEHMIPEILGEAGALPLSRGQRLSVHIRKDDSTFQRAKDGTWFAPIVELRRTNAKGKLLGATAQQIQVGYLGTDTMFEPPPDASHRRAALEALRRWKAALARRIARMPTAGAKSLMPMDVPWPKSPLDLAVQALRHGPPAAPGGAA
jgi:hypothetical protein